MFDWVKATLLGLLVTAGVLVGVRVWMDRSEGRQQYLGKKVITVVWGGYPRREGLLWRELARRFEATHPDVKVKLIWSNVDQKTLLMIASGKPPDIISVSPAILPSLLAGGNIEPLDDYIAKDPNLKLGDFYDVLVKQFRYQGKQYGLPVSFLPFTVFYNKDLFDKYDVPYPTGDWNWEKFRDTCIKMTRDARGKPIKRPRIGLDGKVVRDADGWIIYDPDPDAVDVLGKKLWLPQTGPDGRPLRDEMGCPKYRWNNDSQGAVDWGLYFCWWCDGQWIWVYSNGGRVLAFKKPGQVWAKCRACGRVVAVDPPAKADQPLRCPFKDCGKLAAYVLNDEMKDVPYRLVLDDPQTIQAYRFLSKLIYDDHCVVITEAHSGTPPAKLFREGRIAINGPWPMFSMPDYRRATFDWDVVSGPRGSAGKMTWIVAEGYGISARSKHKQQAYEFLSFICGPEGAKVFCESGSKAPALRTVAESALFLNPDRLPAHPEVLLEPVQQKYGRMIPRASDLWNDVKMELEEAAARCLRYEKHISPEQMAALSIKAGNPILKQAWEESQRRYPKVNWNAVMFWCAAAAGVIVVYAFWRGRRAVRNMGGLARREQVWGYLGISPWLTGMVLLWIGPMVFSIILGFCRWKGIEPLSEARFVGVDNYAKMLSGTDANFTWSLWVTAKFTMLFVPANLLAGLVLALLVSPPLRGIRFYRTAYFLPSILPVVASAVVWLQLFKTKGGLLNHVLTVIGLDKPLKWILGVDSLNWLGTGELIVPAIVIMSLWHVGGSMIIYLGGLQGIPTVLYEAAAIDGAGWWKRLIHVTLPQLSPVIFFNLVMSIIGSMQVFTSAYVLMGTARGGADKGGLFYVLYLFGKAFEQFKMGYASALAWVLFVVILLLTAMVFKSSPLWVYYESQRPGQVKPKKGKR